MPNPFAPQDPNSWKTSTGYTPPENTQPPAWWDPSWGPYEQGLYGKRAPIPGDPASAALGWTQPKTTLPTGLRPDYLQSEAPGRLEAFRRFAEPSITDQFRGSLLESMATMSEQRRTTQRQTSDQLANAGVNKAAYFGRVAPEQNQAFAAGVGGMRGQAMAGEAGALQDLRGGMLDAMNQIEAYYDSLNLQKKLTDDANKVSANAAKFGGLASLAGAGLGAAGYYYGAK